MRRCRPLHKKQRTGSEDHTYTLYIFQEKLSSKNLRKGEYLIFLTYFWYNSVPKNTHNEAILFSAMNSPLTQEQSGIINVQ